MNTDTHQHKERNNGHWGLQKGEGGKMERVKKVLIGYNVYYLGDGYTRSLIPTSMQYTHVTNMYMYPLNLKLNFSKKNAL